MSQLAVGLLGIAAMVLLIALRVPIAVALGLVALFGIAHILDMDAALGLLRIAPYDFAASWEFSAIPMFLLMGAIAFHSGMTASLFRCARLWLGFLPGGLAVATNAACAGFSAASGSSLATTVAMGRITIPEMLRYRYDPGLSTAVVACAGTLGSLIPPSILMIIYGVFAEVSIPALFAAGVLPGLLTAGVYSVMIVGRCWHNPALAPKADEDAVPGEKLRALLEIWPLVVLIIGVIGGIYLGLVTTTEAGALGAVLSIAIAVLRRTLTWAIFRDSVFEALVTSSTIFFIGIGAVLLTRFMALSGVPIFLADFAQEWSIGQLELILALTLVYIVVGCFLDPIGIMLLTLPIFLPLLQVMQIDLIWFGILLIKYLEIGLMTPPLGLNVFAVKVITPSVSTGTIYMGVIWFLLCEVVILALLIGFPQISLWLPSTMQ